MKKVATIVILFWEQHKKADMVLIDNVRKLNIMDQPTHIYAKSLVIKHVRVMT